MLIALRTDSSHRIGTGHLARCLTLADELARRGHEVFFVCRELEGNVSSLVRNQGHDLAMLPPPPSLVGVAPALDEAATAHSAWLGVPQDIDAKETLAALDPMGTPVDWLIVDHYGLDARWETRVRSKCASLMAIDDLADRPHACDLLLDQNLYPDMELRYLGLAADTCRTLLGPRFALLRPGFARERRNLSIRSGAVRRVLVFFGGIDAGNETLKALEALCLVGSAQLAVDVVIGQANPHQNTLRRYCASRPQLRLHVQSEHIAELMAEADLAIGGGGVATWERCALGLPAVVWPLADNQRSVIDAVADYGAAYAPHPDAVANAELLSRHLFSLFSSPHLCRHLGSRAALLCDGLGTRRVAELIAPRTIVLRPATTEDCRNVHGWRNHPEIRSRSANSAPIRYDAHRAWFERSLADPHRDLLIAEQDGFPVGVLRYDFDGSVAVVSVYVAPGMTGRGFGTAVLQAGEAWIRGERPKVTVLRAVVLERNAPSKAIFERCGFSKHHVVYEKAL